MNIGLIGYGKAGRAVANVLRQEKEHTLCWIARKHSIDEEDGIPCTPLSAEGFGQWLDENPVDAIIDFSDADAVRIYGEALRQRRIILLTAISSYPAETLDYLRDLARDIPVMASPNITLGINFMMLAARMLRHIAPFADVEILEQHFREKPEVSGTAKKIAETLEVDDEHITSLRLGGIVGHHEIIFGFPYQTVRLIHNAIRREAFGTGALFAIKQLANQPAGFYTFDELLLQVIRNELILEQASRSTAPCPDSSARRDRAPA